MSLLHKIKPTQILPCLLILINICAGSGSTLRACRELGRNAYGFEVSKQIYTRPISEMLAPVETSQLEFE